MVWVVGGPTHPVVGPLGWRARQAGQCDLAYPTIFGKSAHWAKAHIATLNCHHILLNKIPRL